MAVKENSKAVSVASKTLMGGHINRQPDKERYRVESLWFVPPSRASLLSQNAFYDSICLEFSYLQNVEP